MECPRPSWRAMAGTTMRNSSYCRSRVEALAAAAWGVKISTRTGFGQETVPPSQAGKQLRAHAGQAINNQTDPFARRRIRTPQAFAERRKAALQIYPSAGPPIHRIGFNRK